MNPSDYKNIRQTVGPLMTENQSLRDANAELQRQIDEFKEEVGKLKHHLSPEGEYSIIRSDGKPMSWESLVVSNILLELDELLRAGDA